MSEPITPQVMPADEWAGVRDGDTASRQALDDGHYQRSEFDTECPRCEGEISIGDPISPAGDEWVHPEVRIMSTVVRRKCDGCQREVDTTSIELGHWITVAVNEPKDWREAGHSYRYDLCSFACLERWSQRRHLPRGADSGPDDIDAHLAAIGL